jgi:SNF2 family DNA or RNA helicase
MQPAPALEGPMNLYSQGEFLDPNIIGIGDFYAFRNRYAIMGGYQREIRPGLKVATEIVGYQNLDELMGLLAPYTHEVNKTDVYDLPPKRFEHRQVTLTATQQKLYDEIRKQGTLNLNGNPEIVLKNVLGVSLRLHQVAGGYAVKAREERKIGKDGLPKLVVKYDVVELIKPKENPKMQEVVDIMEEVKGKKQVLLWAVYQPEIDALAGLMRSMGFRVGELHGGVPDADRQPMIREFQAGGIDVIVGNASTGGMGYTMSAAELSIFYNNTFKAIDRVQAEDRPWGHGQTKSGIWVDVSAERTIDLTILQALKMKQDLSEYLRSRLREISDLLTGGGK